jgi:hypothetical protein
MHYFELLTHAEKVQAIHRMAEAGMRDDVIGSATQLSIETERKILGEWPT